MILRWAPSASIPQTVSQATIKAVLESDVNDPKSYVYTLKDNRY